jgi:hypothetical protein
MIVRKAFKYRLYPNREQQERLAVQFGQARYIDNWGFDPKPAAVSGVPSSSEPAARDEDHGRDLLAEGSALPGAAAGLDHPG